MRHSDRRLRTARVVSAALVCALFFVSCASTQNVQSVPDIALPLLRSADRIYSPTLSGDGRHAYFVREVKGNTDIWRIDTTTLTLERLTEDAAEDVSVSLDERGRGMAFASTRDDALFDIYYCDLSVAFSPMSVANNRDSVEKNLTRVAQSSARDTEPVISHDGKSIAFISDRADFAPYVYIVDIRSDETRLLASVPAANPSFSFDDRVVVFVSETENGDYAIMTVSVEDGALTTIAESATPLFAPRYVHGDTIVYYAIPEDTDTDGAFTARDTIVSIAHNTKTGVSYTLTARENVSLHSIPKEESAYAIGLVSRANEEALYLAPRRFFYLPEPTLEGAVAVFNEAPSESKPAAFRALDVAYPYATNDSSRALFDRYIDASLQNDGATVKEVRVLFADTRFSETDAYAAFRALESSGDTLLEALPAYYQIGARLLEAERALLKKDYERALSALHGNFSAQISARDYRRSFERYNRALVEAGYAPGAQRTLAPYEARDRSYEERYRAATDYFSRLSKKRPSVMETDWSDIFSDEHPFSYAYYAVNLETMPANARERFARERILALTDKSAPEAVFLANYFYGKAILFEGAMFKPYFEKAYANAASFADSPEYNEIANNLAEAFRNEGAAFTDANDRASALAAFQTSLEYMPDDIPTLLRSLEYSFSEAHGAIEPMIRLAEVDREYGNPQEHLKLAYVYFFAGTYYYRQALSAQNRKRVIVYLTRREDRYRAYLAEAETYFFSNALPELNRAIAFAGNSADYASAKLWMLSEIYALSTAAHTAEGLVPLRDALARHDDGTLTAVDIDVSSVPMEIVTTARDALNMPRANNASARALFSLNLANGYLTAGAHHDAKIAYSNAFQYGLSALSDEETAWASFFYAYTLWTSEEGAAAETHFSNAAQYFKSAGKTNAYYRALGYLALYALVSENYADAIDRLEARRSLKRARAISDNSYIEEILMIASRLRLQQYEEAKTLCDEIAPFIDLFANKGYAPGYIRIALLGASIPVFPLGANGNGLVAGGYIVDAPLPVEKQEMLASFYAEAYEYLEDYARAHEAIDRQRKYVSIDKTKRGKNSKAAIDAALKNNEGVIYFKSGDYQRAEASFIDSIETGVSAIVKKGATKEERAAAERQNSAKDIANHLNRAYILLVRDKEGDTTRELTDALYERMTFFAAMVENAAIPSGFEAETHSMLGALYYAYALRKTGTQTGVLRAEEDYERVRYLVKAIKRYETVSSSDEKTVPDYRMGIIADINRAHCYRALGDDAKTREALLAANARAAARNLDELRAEALARLVRYAAVEREREHYATMLYTIAMNDVLGLLDIEAPLQVLAEYNLSKGRTRNALNAALAQRRGIYLNRLLRAAEGTRIADDARAYRTLYRYYEGAAAKTAQIEQERKRLTRAKETIERNAKTYAYPFNAFLSERDTVALLQGFLAPNVAYPVVIGSDTWYIAKQSVTRSLPEGHTALAIAEDAFLPETDAIAKIVQDAVFAERLSAYTALKNVDYERAVAVFDTRAALPFSARITLLADAVARNDERKYAFASEALLAIHEDPSMRLPLREATNAAFVIASGLREGSEEALSVVRFLLPYTNDGYREVKETIDRIFTYDRFSRFLVLDKTAKSVNEFYSMFPFSMNLPAALYRLENVLPRDLEAVHNPFPQGSEDANDYDAILRARRFMRFGAYETAPAEEFENLSRALRSPIGISADDRRVCIDRAERTIRRTNPARFVAVLDLMTLENASWNENETARALAALKRDEALWYVFGGANYVYKNGALSREARSAGLDAERIADALSFGDREEVSAALKEIETELLRPMRKTFSESSRVYVRGAEWLLALPLECARMETDAKGTIVKIARVTPSSPVAMPQAVRYIGNDTYERLALERSGRTLSKNGMPYYAVETSAMRQSGTAFFSPGSKETLRAYLNEHGENAAYLFSLRRDASGEYAAWVRNFFRSSEKTVEAAFSATREDADERLPSFAFDYILPGIPVRDEP